MNSEHFRRAEFVPFPRPAPWIGSSPPILLYYYTTMAVYRWYPPMSAVIDESWQELASRGMAIDRFGVADVVVGTWIENLGLRTSCGTTETEDVIRDF